MLLLHCAAETEEANGVESRLVDCTGNFYTAGAVVDPLTGAYEGAAVAIRTLPAVGSIDVPPWKDAIDRNTTNSG